ncbi:hypothetical protein [Stackebrandtia soli]|uniref:hypothetical protein n=1 Tax=Stackebrandtia soli TaxID=1892856 RepID=UPI0039EB7ABE
MNGPVPAIRPTASGIDRQRLAEALRTGPFEHALREAIRLSGLTLERLRHHLGRRGIKVSVSALSYWQRGGNRPERPESLRALRAIEDVLGLPENALIALLGPRRPRGPRPTAELAPQAGTLSTILAQFATGDAAIVEPSHGLSWQWIHEQCVFDDEGRLARSRNIRVIQSKTDGLSRTVLVFRMRDATVDLRCVRGARAGRSRHDSESGYAVFELLFDHALRGGDTLPIEFDLDFGPGDREPFIHRTFQAPVPGYLLELQFDPAALPVRCQRFYRADRSAPPHEIGELLLDARHRVHLLSQGCQAGIHGVRWEWD